MMLPLGAALNTAPVPSAPSSPAAFAAPAATVEFTGYLSSWSRAEGGIPTPGIVDRKVSIKMGIPGNPGEATTASLSMELDGLGVGLSLFAICPHGSPLGADGSCEKLYFQVQTALSGRAKAFCASSLSRHDALPFPVQQCGAPDLDDESRTVGVTLHRDPFTVPRE